jgi:hypothetical protein
MRAMLAGKKAETLQEHANPTGRVTSKHTQSLMEQQHHRGYLNQQCLQRCDSDPQHKAATPHENTTQILLRNAQPDTRDKVSLVTALLMSCVQARTIV